MKFHHYWPLLEKVLPAPWLEARVFNFNTFVQVTVFVSI